VSEAADLYINNTTYAVARQAGGLEGLRPSKNPSFLVVFAGFAGKYHQKIELLGRRNRPKLHHRVSPANKMIITLPKG
jgi:hypothetical protein